MAEADNSLFAIEVDTDDYAETAAGDTPSVPRTYQSEADFAAIKASYTAKQDKGDLYAELLQNVPELNDSVLAAGSDSRKLDKREQLLLGYVAGELYYDREYAEIRKLCERVREACLVDVKLGDNLARWMERAKAREEEQEWVERDALENAVASPV